MTNYTVLMIEDEEDLIEIVSLYLTRNGFTVISATSGEEGLRLARSASPDLILLDVMLPGIDGLEACRLLKQGAGPTRPIPIIMLTANSGGIGIGRRRLYYQAVQCKNSARAGPRRIAAAGIPTR